MPPPMMTLPVAGAAGPTAVGTGAALELAGVSFGFGGRFRGSPVEDSLLLEDVDLEVMPGEIVAITGPNGAGKSTLLRLLNGLHRPLRGDVRVADESIAAVPTGLVARRLGLLFQHPHDQLFERTVLREVLFGLDRIFGTAAPERAKAALAAVGIGDCGNAHPHELPASGQRLLALATVLAREPSVLALDEPTVALDAYGLERLTAAVSAAAGRGAAVVMVTHDLTFATTQPHRLLRLEGRPAPAVLTALGRRGQSGTGCHSRRQEAPAVDALRGSHPVEVRGDSAQEHRPAGAQDHAQVDVLRPRHHALLEHQPDLLGQRVLGPAQHFLCG